MTPLNFFIMYPYGPGSSGMACIPEPALKKTRKENYRHASAVP